MRRRRRGPREPGWLLQRGVHIAPWVGPNRERVLLAITHDQQLAFEPVLVPNRGASYNAVVERTTERLDEMDPVSDDGPHLELFHDEDED